MTATCTITRAAGQQVFNTATGTYTAPPPALIYRGPCKVQDTARTVAEVKAGELQAGVLQVSLHLPVDGEGSGDVRRGDVALIEANPQDPALVGRTYVVQAGHHATAKTARRLPVEEVV